MNTGGGKPEHSVERKKEKEKEDVTGEGNTTYPEAVLRPSAKAFGEFQHLVLMHTCFYVASWYVKSPASLPPLPTVLFVLWFSFYQISVSYRTIETLIEPEPLVQSQSREGGSGREREGERFGFG